jgi:hypothetical protein
MAVTGKTGADAFYKAVKQQQKIWTSYGPKLAAVAEVAHTAGALNATEYAALVAAFNAVPSILAAIAKLADYSNVFE